MKGSFSNYKKGDIVTAQRCVNIYGGINKGDKWMICEASAPEEAIVAEAFGGTTILERNEKRILLSSDEFAYIFEGAERFARYLKNDDNRERNDQLCRRMEHDLKVFASGKAVWCEHCLHNANSEIQKGVESEAGELVCGGCGSGDALDDAVFGGDEAPYALTYELDSALWDRGYLSVEVRDWHNGLFLDPFERTIEVYDTGAKQNLLYVYSDVDEALCDRLIDEARKSIASWAKDPESWNPKV